MEKQNDFYQKFRKEMKEWVESKTGKENKYVDYLMFAPDLFHLLCKLSVDKEVPVKEKAKLVAAIAYFISPLDLIPEIITGPLGYVDDIALAAYVLNGMINKTSEEVVKKHWAGDKDILELIQQIIKVADEMVGSGLWKKIKGMYK